MNSSLQICSLRARNSLPRRNGRAAKPSPSTFVLHCRPTIVTTQRCETLKVAAGHGDLGFDETDYVAADVESGMRIYRSVCSGLRNRLPS